MTRPLERVYPVIFIDAMKVKIRDGQVANRPIYTAIGVTVDGQRDILGLWAGQGGEGAKFWLAVPTEIKNRGVEDCCIVVCDGLSGLPDSIGATWPLTVVQTCVLHLIRNNRLWDSAWSEFVPFLDYAVEIRKVIYSTNAIESLNARMRRATRARGHFPNEQAALKCLYLTIRSLDPTGRRPAALDEPLEARPQRLRHHLRRPPLHHHQQLNPPTQLHRKLDSPHFRRDRAVRPPVGALSDARYRSDSPCHVPGIRLRSEARDSAFCATLNPCERGVAVLAQGHVGERVAREGDLESESGSLTRSAMELLAWLTISSMCASSGA